MSLLQRRRRPIRRLPGDTYTLHLACRDPWTPSYAKLLVAGVIAYAVSPIDLIPDFVPGLGALDDLILVSLGLALAAKMVPKEVMAECREKARLATEPGSAGTRGWLAAGVVIGIWFLMLTLIILFVLKAVAK